MMAEQALRETAFDKYRRTYSCKLEAGISAKHARTEFAVDAQMV
jgi:hypothetical protein